MDSNRDEEEFYPSDDKENNYEYLKTLGKGAYGRVDATKHKETGKIYAK